MELICTDVVLTYIATLSHIYINWHRIDKVIFIFNIVNFRDISDISYAKMPFQLYNMYCAIYRK